MARVRCARFALINSVLADFAGGYERADKKSTKKKGASLAEEMAKSRSGLQV